MHKLICLFALATLGHTAAAAKWEYTTVDYDTKAKFEVTLKTMGEQGWELAACPTTGASSYSAMISGGGSFTGYIGRSVYCIFKRQLP